MSLSSPSFKTRTGSRIDSVLGNLSDSAQHVGDSVSDQTEALERRVGAAWAQMRQLEESAARRARMAAASTDDYVHEHPWQLILAAAALGFAAGAMLGTRRRNHRMHVS